MKRPTAHVFVLGDLACSPRILSHAQYLAKEGWMIDVSGYSSENECNILNGKNLRCLSIMSPPKLFQSIYPTILAFVLKFVFMAACLVTHLLIHCRSDVLIIQNPPAVPTFIVFFLYTKLFKKKLVIDWHNYGYTIKALDKRSTSYSVRLYKALELRFASFCFTGKQFSHLCVSQALHEDMKTKHQITAEVVYDRPPDTFTTCTTQSAHELLMRLGGQYKVLADRGGSCRRTRFTEYTASPGGLTPRWRSDRPALVVSSCSWTADDDFSPMLEALDMYNTAARKHTSSLPPVVVVITGRGPLKDHYVDLISRRNWKWVEVVMPWLEWTDYPLLLSCADLAVSFHRSSSGLDLPMKVVDFLGVGVPVLALAYPTLEELLPSKKAGHHFTTSKQLSAQLIRLLAHAAKGTVSGDTEDGRWSRVNSHELSVYRLYIQSLHTQQLRGHDYWRSVALPIFQNALRST